MVPTDTDITVQCTQSLPYLISFFLVRSGQEKYYGRKNYYGPIKSFGPSPNTSMLIISCLCLTSACATDISSQRIQRINYRVVFEKVNDLYLGQEHWLHTFQIPLPKKIHLHELYCNMPQCKTAGHIVKSLNSLRMQCMASVNSSVHHIHKLIPTTELPAAKRYIGTSRSKRGLFDLVGEIFKSLFGTATSDDITTLQRHMQVLNNSNVKLANAMAHQDQHLSFFINTVDKRFSNVLAAVQKNHQDAVEISRLAHASMDALDHEFLIISQLIIKQTNVSAQLEKKLEYINLGIHDLVKGKLSPFLLSPHVLKSSLNQVQNIITEKFPQFQVSNKDLLFYYSFGDFLYTRRHLYLTVKIPIYSFHLPISVYKVYSYPVPVNSSSNHATQLMNTPPYFLNTKDHQHYALITSQQLSQCKGTTTLFCSFNIALKASASPSCLSAVFFNHKEAVSKVCDFRFLTNILPTAMYELSPSHLLLYRTTMIALDCANGQRILKGCSFCVVKIPCLCSVTSNNLYLPPRLGKCNNRTDKVTILHPVNLALLQQFFDKDAHSTVFGDTIFEDFVHITLPNFQIFNRSFSQ